MFKTIQELVGACAKARMEFAKGAISESDLNAQVEKLVKVLNNFDIKSATRLSLASTDGLNIDSVGISTKSTTDIVMSPWLAKAFFAVEKNKKQLDIILADRRQAQSDKKIALIREIMATGNIAKEYAS